MAENKRQVLGTPIPAPKMKPGKRSGQPTNGRRRPGRPPADRPQED